MLKKINIISVLIILAVVLIGCASLEKVEDPNAEISKIFETELSKDQIYDRSLQFIAQNFKSAKAVIEYQDRDAGRIIGNGSTNISDGLMNRPASFTMIIDIKENRYRVFFTNLQYQSGTKMPWGPIEYKTPYNNMVLYLNGLASRLNIYLRSSKDNEDW